MKNNIKKSGFEQYRIHNEDRRKLQRNGDLLLTSIQVECSVNIKYKNQSLWYLDTRFGWEKIQRVDKSFAAPAIGRHIEYPLQFNELENISKIVNVKAFLPMENDIQTRKISESKTKLLFFIFVYHPDHWN